MLDHGVFTTSLTTRKRVSWELRNYVVLVPSSLSLQEGQNLGRAQGRSHTGHLRGLFTASSMQCQMLTAQPDDGWWLSRVMPVALGDVLLQESSYIGVGSGCGSCTVAADTDRCCMKVAHFRIPCDALPPSWPGGCGCEVGKNVRG